MEYFQGIPIVTEITDRSRLQYLREHLQSEGRTREAHAILDEELSNNANSLNQQAACKSLLQACSDRSESQEPVWLITGKTRTRLGQSLTGCGQLGAGKEEFGRARDALRTVSAAGRENNTLLVVRLAEINACKISGWKVLLDAFDIFVRSPNVQRDNNVYKMALSRATTAAIEILELDACPRNRTIFWEWYAKGEALLRKLGDVAYLSVFRTATGDIACSLYGDHGGILSWHQLFESQYPSFHLWAQKTLARRTALLIYNRLRDEEGILRTIADMRDIAVHQDSFWHEDGFRKQEDIRRQLGEEEVGSVSVPVALQIENPHMEWLFKWGRDMPVGYSTGWTKLDIQVGSDSVKRSTILEEKLCSWIKEDFQAGILAERHVQNILSCGLVRNRSSLIETLENRQTQMDEPGGSNTAPSTGAPKGTSIYTSAEDVMSLTPTVVSTGVYGTEASPANTAQWDETFLALSDWLLQKSTRPEADRHYMLYQAQNQRFNYVDFSDSAYQTRALEAQRLIDLFPVLHAAVQQQISSSVNVWRSVIAGAKQKKYIESHGHDLLDMHCPEFEEIIKIYDQCLAENHGNAHPIRSLHLNMDIATLYFPAATRLDPTAISGFFNAISRSMRAFDTIREGWRALTGWDKVQKLLHALEDRRILQLARVTILVARQFHDDQSELRNKCIWETIQFAKSIGIGWLMASNTAHLWHDIVKKEACQNSACNEAYASQNAAEVSDTPGALGTTEPRASRDDRVTTLNKGQGNLQENIDQAIAPEVDQTNSDLFADHVQAELQTLNRSGADTVFVDWYSGSCIPNKSPCPLVTTFAGHDEGPRYCLAKIEWQDVEKIVKAFTDLETEELQDRKRTRLLYKLNPLVEPLSWTKPGQTLVFSPCGDLHHIPLHALKIDGEIVIKRNPVVYCSSLSALAVASRIRKQMEQGILKSITANDPLADDTGAIMKPGSAPKVSCFGDPPTGIGKAALERTAATFNSKAHSDSEFKATSFVTTIQDPNLRLLHYHGHANFSPTSPTDHSLLFSDRVLTLREIFDIPPPDRDRGGFHVTLLGCGSGMSKTTPTDDVMGLVPSFLHAGASSAVSALWPFADEDAATYSDSFYGAFANLRAEQNKDTSGASVVDLAEANQKAILEIMHKRSGLYHWGAFVLNGYWMMDLPG